MHIFLLAIPKETNDWKEKGIFLYFYNHIQLCTDYVIRHF